IDCLDERAIERTAAEAKQTRVAQRLEVDEHARPERKRADAPPRLANDDIANREGLAADQNALADLDAKLQQQIALHDHTMVGEQRVRVWPSTLEFDHAI